MWVCTLAHHEACVTSAPIRSGTRVMHLLLQRRHPRLKRSLRAHRLAAQLNEPGVDSTSRLPNVLVQPIVPYGERNHAAREKRLDVSYL